MAQSLARLAAELRVRWDYRDGTTLPAAVTASTKRFFQSLTQGTAAGNGNRFFINQYTIAGAARQTLDLVGGITDAFGNTLSFTKVKGIWIEHLDTTAGGPVLVGGGTDGAGTNAFVNWIVTAATEVRVRNPGLMFFACDDATSYAASAGSDILGILNEHATVDATVLVILWGIGS